MSRASLQLANGLVRGRSLVELSGIRRRRKPFAKVDQLIGSANSCHTSSSKSEKFIDQVHALQYSHQTFWERKFLQANLLIGSDG